MTDSLIGNLSAPRRNWTMALLGMGLLFVVSTASFWYMGWAHNDDIRLANSMRDGFFTAWGDIIDASVSKGRLHVFTFVSYSIPHLIDSLWYYRATMIGVLLIVGVLFALLVGQMTNSKWMGATSFVLYSLFLQNYFQFSPVSAIGFPSVSLCFMLGSLLVFVYSLTAQRPHAWMALSMVLFLCALMTYELYAVYTPVFAGLALVLGHSLLRSLRLSAGHLGVVVVYVVAWVVFRWSTGGSYGGTAIYLQDGATQVLGVAWSFATWAIPGSVFLDPKFQYIASDILSADGLIASLHGALAAKLVVGAACLYVLWREARTGPEVKTSPSAPWHRRALVVALLAYCFVAPSLLPALTEQYQVQYDESGYLTSFYSLFPVVVVLALALRYVFSGRRPMGAAVGLLVGGAVALVPGALTGYTNDVVSRAQGGMYCRHEAVKALAQTKTYRALPSGTVIVAPSLFEPVLSLSFAGGAVFNDKRHGEWNYWTGYLRRVGGGDVTVQRTPLPTPPSGTAPTYYMQHFQERIFPNECSLVFAKLSRNTASAMHATELLVVHATPGLRLALPIVDGHGDIHVVSDGDIKTYLDDHTAVIVASQEVSRGVHRVRIENGAFDLDAMTTR